MELRTKKNKQQEMVTMKALTTLYTLSCLLMITSVCSVSSVGQNNTEHNRNESGVGSTCDFCCNGTVQNTSCTNLNVTDFKAVLNVTYSNLKEGGSLVIQCVHNLPGQLNNMLAFVWFMNGHSISGQNKSVLSLERLGLDTGHQLELFCMIRSPCGNLTSDAENFKVQDNSLLIIVVCGVAAVVLVLAMGLCMKLMLKREFGQMKNRRQNAQHLQGTTPT
ncbi:uncharacterized protein LOC105025827 isoform X2 [Esox lucius]|uniref:uncharacterized protein LOC105025827 isoform X2 n=1 Tax=Esox lucius TaxID=8010 RepID=UPI0005763B65|nr:uncharacterized protein LOC105025827 isoform X2 [Esox lucius]